MSKLAESIKDSIVKNLKELEKQDDAYKISRYVFNLKALSKDSYVTVEDLVKIISQDTDLVYKVLKEVLNIDYEEIVSQSVSKFMEDTKIFSINNDGTLNIHYTL